MTSCNTPALRRELHLDGMRSGTNHSDHAAAIAIVRALSTLSRRRENKTIPSLEPSRGGISPEELPKFVLEMDAAVKYSCHAPSATSPKTIEKRQELKIKKMLLARQRRSPVGPGTCMSSCM
jgi:hypothetical protein